MGNLNDAKAYYMEALRRKPGFALVLVNLASIHDQLGEKVEADDCLLKALQSDPSYGPAHLNISIRYLREGLSDAAIFHLRMATNDGNLGKNAPLYLGIAYKQKGRYGAALLHLRKALALDPMNLTVRLHLIDGYHAKGLESEARIEASNLARIIVQKEALLRAVIDLLSKERDSLFAQPAHSLIALVTEALEGESGKSRVENKDNKFVEKDVTIR
jgi:protein O-GlcNAc transferase